MEAGSALLTSGNSQTTRHHVPAGPKLLQTHRFGGLVRTRGQLARELQWKHRGPNHDAADPNLGAQRSPLIYTSRIVPIRMRPMQPPEAPGPCKQPPAKHSHALEEPWASQSVVLRARSVTQSSQSAPEQPFWLALRHRSILRPDSTSACGLEKRIPARSAAFCFCLIHRTEDCLLAMLFRPATLCIAPHRPPAWPGGQPVPERFAARTAWREVS